ncbi:MAG: hypothetical protein ACTJHR_09450, partial [Corynebacterium casei]|uniref:hypothetical protein n=2 Tax=Corynebacterium casei TaxID=160386 RepID=UPI0026483368
MMAEKRCFKVANLAHNADNLEIGHLDDYERPNFNLYHSLYENGTVKPDLAQISTVFPRHGAEYR